jgi:hypothetical protein
MPVEVEAYVDGADDEAAAPGADKPRFQLASLMPRTEPRGPVLTAGDREKLSDVLRELLDCKRLLERAREG